MNQSSGRMQQRITQGKAYSNGQRIIISIGCIPLVFQPITALIIKAATTSAIKEVNKYVTMLIN